MCLHKVTGLRYAAKVVKLRSNTSFRNSIQDEIAVLKAVTPANHPNILRLIDMFLDHSDSSVFMVLELAPEGELFNLIVTKQKLTEEEARTIFSQLFSAVGFLVS